jgi:LPXTG-motif cell wall-anchored protein
MSLTRRLAAGLPAVGVTVFAALALGAPASAAPGDQAAQPAVMTTPCTGDARDCATGSGYAGPSATATDHVRGNGGYGTVGPSTSPTAPTSPTPSESTPTGTVESVPPSGVSPTTVSPNAVPSPSSPGGGGVSPAGTLPLTGAPGAGLVGLGALLVAAGAGAVWYTRRRRSA